MHGKVTFFKCRVTAVVQYVFTVKVCMRVHSRHSLRAHTGIHVKPLLKDAAVTLLKCALKKLKVGSHFMPYNQNQNSFLNYAKSILYKSVVRIE